MRAINTRRICLAATLSLMGAIASPAPATAQTPEPKTLAQSLTATLEAQEFSQDRGSLRSLQFDYKIVDGATTVLLSPVIGRRDSPGVKASALGLGGSLYRNWTRRYSTRTYVFAAENDPVFPHFDIAQDLTARVARRTTVTGGVRWAEYFGDREVIFLSLGARRYFEGGSVAYRLTLTDPEGSEAFLAHLASLTLNDGEGNGKTQLWAGAGATSLSPAQLDTDFSGNDYSFLIQRTQPLADTVAFIAAGGVTSYDSPTGRYTGAKFGLGLSIDLEAQPLLDSF